MLEVIPIAFLSGLTTFIGVWLALRFKERKKMIAIGIGFSAGIMLSVSLLELLPAAFSLASAWSAIMAFALGFGLVFAFDTWLPHTHFMPEKGRVGRLLRISYLVALGIIIHDFPEGFAMASAYSWNAWSGILIAIAIALHNIPEEFALSVPLVLLNKKKTLLLLALASALAEPLGAIAGLGLFFFFPFLNPLLMAFAAGAMIFISLDELLPLAKRYGKENLVVLGVLSGLILYALLTAFI